jgi:hypothetical protein
MEALETAQEFRSGLDALQVRFNRSGRFDVEIRCVTSPCSASRRVSGAFSSCSPPQSDAVTTAGMSTCCSFVDNMIEHGRLFVGW